MANEQQATFPIFCSVESSFPDMLPLDRARLPCETGEMDVSPGRISAQMWRNSLLFPAIYVASSPISILLIFCFPLESTFYSYSSIGSDYLFPTPHSTGH